MAFPISDCVKTASIKQSQLMRARKCIAENCAYGKLNSRMLWCSNQDYALSSYLAVKSCAAQVIGCVGENAKNVAGGRT